MLVIESYNNKTNLTIFNNYTENISLNFNENKNILYVNVTVQPGDTYLASTERLLLDNNDELYANTTANSTMSTTLTYTNI